MVFGDFLRAVKKRVFARRIVVTRLYCQELRNIREIALDSTVRASKLDPERIKTVLEVYPVDLDRDLRRLASGKSCYVAWIGSRAAHFSWVQDKGVHAVWGTGRRRTLRKGDFWIYSCRTSDWAKGRHLYPVTLVHILREYAGKGFCRAFIYVDERNAASVRGIERAGFILHKRLRTLLVNRFFIPLP